MEKRECTDPPPFMRNMKDPFRRHPHVVSCYCLAAHLYNPLLCQQVSPLFQFAYIHIYTYLYIYVYTHTREIH
ncbi:hypothetical protein BX666DRAFT_1262297 [Dichotomocladium elegans]|nr:hypothetical protein BX666DRAFT_1262297 [Dichotomocladium elegans]